MQPLPPRGYFNPFRPGCSTGICAAGRAAFHFHWGDAVKPYFTNKQGCNHLEIFPGVHIYTTAGQGIMLSLVEFEPGAVVEEHQHRHEQMGMVLEGRAEFVVGGESRVLGPGDMYCIPGGVRHKVIAREGAVRALDVFHPPREDYL